MSKYIPLGEICHVYDGPHATPTKIASGPIYLGIDAITEDGRLNPAEYNHLAEEDFFIWTKRVTPQKNDIVFSYEATLGRYAIIPEDFYGCLGRRLSIVRAKDNRVNPLWLYYYFLSPEWGTYIANHTIRGSTVDRVSVEDLPSFPIPLPNRTVQDSVVGVLSTIDRKIDNNNHSCSELESMAKTIYDYWFTQYDFPDADGKPYRSSGGAMKWNEQLKREIPCGWKAENIQTVCSIIDCLHSQKPEQEYISEEYYLLQLENLVDLGLIDLKSKYYVSEKMYDLWTNRIEVKDGDLVVTNAGRVGAVSRIPNYVTAGMGRNMTAIRPERIPAFFLYYFFRSPDFSVQMRANTDAGAFFGSLNVRGIKQLTLTIPPKDSDILVQFDSVVEPMRRKIEALQLENEQLSKLRNWLLPMLMNGQATVADTEEEVSKAIPFAPPTVEVRQAARNFGDKKTDDTADLVKAFMRRKQHDSKA